MDMDIVSLKVREESWGAKDKQVSRYVVTHSLLGYVTHRTAYIFTSLSQSRFVCVVKEGER